MPADFNILGKGNADVVAMQEGYDNRFVVQQCISATEYNNVATILDANAHEWMGNFASIAAHTISGVRTPPQKCASRRSSARTRRVRIGTKRNGRGPCPYDPSLHRRRGALEAA
ncbi:MAG: hypothetical protein GW893_19580 [Armatimonadetes bacterium]|nr:hypothetical protein [Armatimonadota bacterium]PIY42636.1 MAG: hypothetical protein COZ05_13385 [Armatimonadetes bacterium CG_4_10_14_3_um_filter_59_10]PJB73282.1 MAG: hypothetical protein CO095_06015 [Armatimonadetes bacterium CG_4_9_14_3_um_filter_58_7]